MAPPPLPAGPSPPPSPLSPTAPPPDRRMIAARRKVTSSLPPIHTGTVTHTNLRKVKRRKSAIYVKGALGGSDENGSQE